MIKLLLTISVISLSLGLQAANQPLKSTDTLTISTLPTTQPTSSNTSTPEIIETKPTQPGTNPLHNDSGTATDAGPTNPMAPTAPSHSPGP